MSLQADRDYLFIGTASLYLPNRVIASGPLLVTPASISYGNFHETDPFAGNRKAATSIKAAVADVKESVTDLKGEFASHRNLSAARKYMKEVLEHEETLEGVHRKMDEWAAADSDLMRLSRDDIAAIKTGFFAGLQVTMKDGTVHKFRCGKLKAIKAMLGFA